MFSTSPLRRTPVWATDFAHNGNQQGTFVGNAILTGTAGTSPAAGVITKEHPGVVLMRSSATPNSGFRFITDVQCILLGGGERIDVNFWTPAAFTTTTLRVGFLDTSDSSAPVDGAWMEFSGSGAIVGKTSANSVVSTTATLATLAVTTWYHGRMAVNEVGTSIDFTVYSDAGASLGTAALTTNIPTASGRETGAGIVVTNSGSSAVDLLAVDYLAVTFARALARGFAT